MLLIGIYVGVLIVNFIMLVNLTKKIKDIRLNEIYSLFFMSMFLPIISIFICVNSIYGDKVVISKAEKKKIKTLEDEIERYKKINDKLEENLKVFKGN